MTVAENMFLGREPRKRNLIVDEKAVNQEAQVFGLPATERCANNHWPVSVAQQQMVEIARALTLNAKLIIMDEPSAALSDSEVESLHRVVRELKGRGVSIITSPIACMKFFSSATSSPFSRMGDSPGMALHRPP
jgi:inositol transport system ATP-binding protein